MELSNAMGDFVDAMPTAGSSTYSGFAFDTLVRLMAPMTPHLSRGAVGANRTHGQHLRYADARRRSETYARDESFDLVIQVNSKIRARETVPADTDTERMKAIALAHPRIHEILDGRPPKRVVVIQNRLVNHRDVGPTRTCPWPRPARTRVAARPS